MKVYVYRAIDEERWGHKYIIFIGRYYIHCDHIPNKKVTKKYIHLLCTLPDNIFQVLGKEFITLNAVDAKYSFILKQKYTI